MNATEETTNTDKKDKKICPITSIGCDDWIFCQEEKCAIWIPGEEGYCSIRGPIPKLITIEAPPTSSAFDRMSLEDFRELCAHVRRASIEDIKNSPNVSKFKIRHTIDDEESGKE